MKSVKKCKICGKKVLAKGLCEKHYHREFRHERYERNRGKELLAANEYNRKKRKELLEKLSPDSRCFECGKKINLAGKRTSFVIGKNVVCVNCWNSTRKIKKFSREYSKCVNCGTTTIKHAGHGLCSRCYSGRRRQ